MTAAAPDTHAALHFLLGDWRDPQLRTVGEWRARLDTAARPSLSGLLRLPDAQDLTRGVFESACAELHDSRLWRAYYRFVEVVGTAHARGHHTLESLARLGAAHCQALLKRHARAAYELGMVAAVGDPTLALVAHLFATANLSNWGKPVGESTDVRPVPHGLPRPLEDLLDAYRAYVMARLCLRAGARAEGIALLDAVIAQPRFPQLHPIVRGHLYRMAGILLDVSGRKAKGRDVLATAIGAYESVGYDLGVVQAATSLARVTESIDPVQTRRYLARAQEIIDHTDHPSQERIEGRQMFGERAALLSRRAHLEFAAGHIDAAIVLCKEDLGQVRQLASNLPDGLPREEAIVHRHLGRMYLAQARFAEAEPEFARSATLFARVGDVMNVFFSRARRATALFGLGRLDEAATEVAALADILRERPPHESRDKEDAIVATFQATLHWRLRRDAVMAQAVLGRAVDTLRRFGRDYYYGAALVLDAEILEQTGDRLSAHHRLLEARACADAVEAEDLRRVIAERLRDLPLEPVVSQVKPILERRELTVLFADLRDFTSAAARIEPVKMASFISDFAERVSRGTIRHGGHPTRFLGDCVMALFGLNPKVNAPKELLAAQAACDIYELFRNLRAIWDHTPELARIGLGFGITTGEVVVGRFGWQELSEFSAIGERVNLASRLQGCARDGEVYFCPETFRVLDHLHDRLRGEERTEVLKGVGAQRTFRTRMADLIDDLSTPRREV